MKLAFDIDGCLAHFTAGYAALIREVSGRDLLTPEMIANPPCWNWDLAAGYTKEEERAAWHHIFNDVKYHPKKRPGGDFWLRLPPLPTLNDDFFQHLNEVTEEHDVYFLTHRAGYRAKFQTEQWLRYHFINVPTVLLTGDKVPILKSLDIDAFVDDKPETLQAVADEFGPSIRLFKVNYTYNVDAPGEGVASVGDMLRELDLV